MSSLGCTARKERAAMSCSWNSVVSSFERGTSKPSLLARSKLHQITRPGALTTANSANRSGPRMSIACESRTPFLANCLDSIPRRRNIKASCVRRRAANSAGGGQASAGRYRRARLRPRAAIALERLGMGKSIFFLLRGCRIVFCALPHRLHPSRAAPLGTPGRATAPNLHSSNQRQNLAAKESHFLEVRPTHEKKLRNADAPVFHDRVRDLNGAAHQRDRRRAQVRNRAGPKIRRQQLGLVRFGQRQRRFERDRVRLFSKVFSRLS